MIVDDLLLEGIQNIGKKILQILYCSTFLCSIIQVKLMYELVLISFTLESSKIHNYIDLAFSTDPLPKHRPHIQKVITNYPQTSNPKPQTPNPDFKPQTSKPVLGLIFQPQT